MEYYIGNPRDRHQCYRQMAVDNDYCLDPVTQSECNRNPHPLESGQTVYFSVLPKFMNVDIRITIDVNGGPVDLFLTTEEEMFQVNENKETWVHEVKVDPRFKVFVDIPERKNYSLFSANTDNVFELKDFDEAANDDLGFSAGGRRSNFKVDLEALKEKRKQALLKRRKFKLRRKKRSSSSSSLNSRQPHEMSLYQSNFFSNLDDPTGQLRFNRQSQLRKALRKTKLVAQLASNIVSEFAYDFVYTFKNCTEAGNGTTGSYGSGGLHQFVRLTRNRFVLHVKDLRNRLVVSLPESIHDLRTTRFFLIVQTTSSPSSAGGNSMAAFGQVTFRQDQLHLDLFVFFSVFFSCFFLFLSICVLVFQLKHINDVRRARRLHQVEMEYMAQRPFAVQLVLFPSVKQSAPHSRSSMPMTSSSEQSSLMPVTSSEQNRTMPVTSSSEAENLVPMTSSSEHSRLLPVTSSTGAAAFQPHVTSSSSLKRHNLIYNTANKTRNNAETVRPLAIEPLADNHAAVATVLIQMPEVSARSSRGRGRSGGASQTLTFGCVLISSASSSKAAAAFNPKAAISTSESAGGATASPVASGRSNRNNDHSSSSTQSINAN